MIRFSLRHDTSRRARVPPCRRVGRLDLLVTIVGEFHNYYRTVAENR